MFNFKKADSQEVVIEEPDLIQNENTLSHEPAETVAATPKKRGRKPASASSAPEAETFTTTSESPRRKRTSASSKKQLEGLTQQLIGVHKMIAVMPGLAVMEIAEPEAEVLASAMVAIGEEYGVALGGKSGAALQMGLAVAMIYGPRVVHLAKTKKLNRATDITSETTREENPNPGNPDFQGPSNYSDQRGSNVNAS